MKTLSPVFSFQLSVCSFFVFYFWPNSTLLWFGVFVCTVYITFILFTFDVRLSREKLEFVDIFTAERELAADWLTLRTRRWAVGGWKLWSACKTLKCSSVLMLLCSRDDSDSKITFSLGVTHTAVAQSDDPLPALVLHILLAFTVFISSVY